jgi:hypothetical protein
LDIESTSGTLTLAQAGGWLETGALMTLEGQDVVIQGVVRSSLATAATFDEEVTITATRDVTLGGNFSLAGSILVDAGRDILAPQVKLTTPAAGQHLTLSALRDITVGGSAGTGSVLEADKTMTLSAGRDLTIESNAVLYSQANDSLISLQAQSVRVVGAVNAGAEAPNGTLDAGEDANSNGVLDGLEDKATWTGRRAAIDVVSGSILVIGSATAGGDLWATGTVTVNTSADSRGIGIEMLSLSSIRVDETAKFNRAAGVWADGSSNLNGRD